MKISEILRKAAMEHLTDGESLVGNKSNSCCCAIADVEGILFVDQSDSVIFFKDLFYPDTGGGFWWPNEKTKSQCERFMALLFAAECAESEGL